MVRAIPTGATAMPHNWWTRRILVLAATAALIAGATVAAGLSHPEPAASAALGPDWQCSRLALVFTTCSRVKNTEAVPVRMAKIPVCLRLRT